MKQSINEMLKNVGGDYPAIRQHQRKRENFAQFPNETTPQINYKIANGKPFLFWLFSKT